MIIGGWRIKYLKARQKPKKKIHKAYAERNEKLPYMGYATYREYLASDEWKSIRERRLARRPRCLVCESAAVVVHHMSYDERTMLGLDGTYLVCLCHRCHERIEIDGVGGKRTLREANLELLSLATAAGRHGWVAHMRAMLGKLHERLSRDGGAMADGDRERAKKAKKKKKGNP